MGKELQRWDENYAHRARMGELARMRRQRRGLRWATGVCLVLTVGAVLVISYAGKDLAWLLNVLLALSAAWIITGALTVVFGVSSLLMTYEIDSAAEEARLAARLNQQLDQGF